MAAMVIFYLLMEVRQRRNMGQGKRPWHGGDECSPLSHTGWVIAAPSFPERGCAFIRQNMKGMLVPSRLAQLGA